MPSWSGKTRGGILGYKFFVFVIHHLGLYFSYFLLAFVVIYFLFTSPKSIKANFYYFRKIQRFSFFKSCWYIYKNFFVFGQTLIDKLYMLTGKNDSLSFIFDGEDYLHQLAQNGRGAMLISGHVGSFEIAAYLLKRIDAKINILMYEAEHEHIKKYLSSVYKDSRAHIITIKPDMSHIYDIKRAFENNEFLCLHGDRFTEGSKTLDFDFMGEKAAFPLGPFYLAMKFNVPVSFVFAMKDKPFQYHFYASNPMCYYQEKLNLNKREAYVREIIGNYILSFEKMLKKYPAQWFNFYYFWKKEF